MYVFGASSSVGVYEVQLTKRTGLYCVCMALTSPGSRRAIALTPWPRTQSLSTENTKSAKGACVYALIASLILKSLIFYHSPNYIGSHG